MIGPLKQDKRQVCGHNEGDKICCLPESAEKPRQDNRHVIGPAEETVDYEIVMWNQKVSKADPYADSNRENQQPVKRAAN